jgi:replicative DNA helicase
MSQAEVALLGHLIGDGCTLPRHAVQYTTKEIELAELVAKLTQDRFGHEIVPRIQKERGWYQVYLSAGQRLTHGVRNPIALWLDQLGVWGLRSHQKRVPATLFAQSDEKIGLFLRHLWATDGCVRMTYGKSVRPAIYYASSSEQLAFDVQSLLLRLGINARKRTQSQGERGRPQHHVAISGREEIYRFLDLIGVLDVAARQEQAEAIRLYLADKVSNTNRDVIPKDVWRLHAAPSMEQLKMTTRQMQAQMGGQYSGTSLYQANLSRERAERVAQIVDSAPLMALAQSDVYWDKIHSIEPDGVEDVYDLTVAGLHNFVANNIIVHNSIEQDADVVMFVYREDYYIEDTDRQNIADVIVAKHRHGSTGTLSLFFRKELTQFRDLEIRREELDY